MMVTFLKANIASLVASLSDFLITVLLVQWCGTKVVMAAAAGTITATVAGEGDNSQQPIAETKVSIFVD